MVALGFKKRFVDPIRAGLGEFGFVDNILFPVPKRHTIRANGKRPPPRPGQELQLYCGMRTKGCFLIGRARCVRVRPIVLMLHAHLIIICPRKVRRSAAEVKLSTVGELHDFARSDGFENFAAMVEFWKVEHANTTRFEGQLIEWEPL